MRTLKRIGIAALSFVVASALITQVARIWIEARVPQDGVRIEVGGTHLHVLDQGEGPAIVLIHGLLGQMRNFAPDLVDTLAQEHRVILVDRPGSGYSDALPAGTNGIAEQSDSIAALIEKMDLGAPTVVGHSLGGAVALSLALDHPTNVGAVALIAPATQPQREAPSAFAALTLETNVVRRALAFTLATPVGITVFNRSAAALFAPEPLLASFSTIGGGLLAVRPENFLAGGNDLMALRDALPDLSMRYSELNLPIDILFGAGDQILDPMHNGRSVAEQIPGATYTEIDGGHMIPFTAPDVVAEWILDAADRVGQPKEPLTVSEEPNKE